MAAPGQGAGPGPLRAESGRGVGAAEPGAAPGQSAAALPPDSAKTETLILGLEFRPRTEMRYGYRQLRNESVRPAVFTENRTRLVLDYQRPGFRFHLAPQDIRVWGEQDPRSSQGSVQLFEGYVEPSFSPRWSMRIGRQAVKYDNQRLFAENNWRQNGGSHDGAALRYQAPRFQSELFGAFNQPEDAVGRFFESSFDVDFVQYKALMVSYSTWQSGPWRLMGLHASDVYQDTAVARRVHWRHTSGGRVTYAEPGLTLTLAAYAQYGFNRYGLPLRAWYAQPEVQYQADTWLTLFLGAEVFSGDDQLSPNSTDNSFDPLYGVNHRFLGFMDLFIRFPLDPAGGGLIAPYLFVQGKAGERFSARADAHLFYSQNRVVPNGAPEAQPAYLGFEQDFVAKYFPNKFSTIELGYSFGLFTPSMDGIKPGGDASLMQHWAYLMVTIKPELFRWTRTYAGS
jgi:hypothetical protein